MNNLLKKLTLFFTMFFFLISNSYAVDLIDSNQNSEVVDLVVNKYKIIPYFPDKTFRGNTFVDRYTYSGILYNTIEVLNKNMKQIEQNDIFEFSDIKEDKYNNITDFNKNNVNYNKAIVLLNSGLIRVFSDNTFKGDKPVDYLGFAVGMGRLMKIFYDDAPPVLRKKWKMELSKQIVDSNEIPTTNPVYEPLKLSLENNLIILKPNSLNKPISRYEAAESIIKLINKFDELRKYIVFTKI
jgi:hypothetical protein